MINSRSLEDLDPVVKPWMLSFIARAELRLQEKYPETRWKIVPTCTLRDGQYQQSLYDQGRTTPGSIVTNAKPGSSCHEFGCAMDFAIQKDGKIIYEPRELYELCGEVAIDEGLTWGGDWNANHVHDRPDWDLCHVQYTSGLTLAQLQAGSRPIG